MRRALACLIAVVLAGGGAAALSRSGDGGVDHWLPSVLPIGYELQAASVAPRGSTLLGPLEHRFVRYYRGQRFVFAGRTDGSAPENVGPAARPFLDGVAAVVHGEGGETSLRWSTSIGSGYFVATDLSDERLLAFARRVVGSGFRAPAGWQGVNGFDRSTAVEVLQYGSTEHPRDAFTVLVHRALQLSPVPLDTDRQRRLGDVVVTVTGSSLSAEELDAVAHSVAQVSASTWADAMAAAELDGRPTRWRTLARGTTSAGIGWAFALADRGDEVCPAVVSTRNFLAREPRCAAQWWLSDPVIAVPTGRVGPVTVTAASRELRPLAEARWRGRRIVIAEVPKALQGGILDPVEVVSRR